MAIAMRADTVVPGTGSGLDGDGELDGFGEHIFSENTISTYLHVAVIWRETSTSTSIVHPTESNM